MHLTEIITTLVFDQGGQFVTDEDDWDLEPGDASVTISMSVVWDDLVWVPLSYSVHGGAEVHDFSTNFGTLMRVRAATWFEDEHAAIANDHPELWSVKYG